jgi:hypothetical protein
MAALVLAVGIGSVARFCPQDLKLASGNHPAKSTPAAAAAITADAKPIDPTPVITPTTFTTVGAPAAAAVPTVIVASNAPATPKKPASTPRVRGASSPAGSASATASAAASGSPALPENPYPESSQPETYGF